MLDGWDTAEAARPPLRTYAAWVSEADQRAAGTFDNHLPALPVNLDDLDEVVIAPGAETIRAAAAHTGASADLRAAITCGAFRTGDHLPTVEELAARYRVAASTAHRAISELSTSGLVIVSRGGAPLSHKRFT